MHHAKEITREVLNAIPADSKNKSALWYLAANHPPLISTLLNTNADIIDPNTFFKRAHEEHKSAYECLLDTPVGRGVLDTLKTKTSLLNTIEASIKLANKPSKILAASTRDDTPLELPSSMDPETQKAIKPSSPHKKKRKDRNKIDIDAFKANDDSGSRSVSLLSRGVCSNKDAGPPTKAPKHEAGQSPGGRP